MEDGNDYFFEECKNLHNRESHFKVLVRHRSFFLIDNLFIDLLVFDGRFKKNPDSQ